MTETAAQPSINSCRTLSGLGDAVLAAPIVAHFSQFGKVDVSTKYPDVFKFIQNVNASPDVKNTGPTLRYSRGQGRNYYVDICAAAGLSPLPFSLPWVPEPHVLELFGNANKRSGRKICLIKEPSSAHMHRGRNNFSFSPHPMTIQKWMLEHRDEFFFVSVEHETNDIARRLVGIDAKVQALSVSEYLSVCFLVDHIATQFGHLSPIAQAFGKPLTLFEPQDPLTGLFKHVTASAILVPKEFAPSPVEVI